MSVSHLSMSTCIFCSIIARRAPASIVYEDEAVIAFMDIAPVNPGHLLVIPKQHATYLAHLDEAVAGRLMQIAHRLAAALRAIGVRCEGVNLFLADGEAAGQEVFHVHLHVIPRFRGDRFQLRFNASQATRDELDRVADKVRVVLSTTSLPPNPPAG